MIFLRLTVSTFALVSLFAHSEAHDPRSEERGKAEIKQAFKTVNADANGQITKEQLRQVMGSTGIFSIQSDGWFEVMVDIVMIMADEDEDNLVTETDVVQAFVNLGSEAYYVAFYNVFDKNASGGLDIEELTQVDLRLDPGGSEYGARLTIARDIDGDGEVTLREMMGQ